MRKSNEIDNARRLVVSQGVASVGATLATFGIDVWFYEETGSYSYFAAISMLAMLPPIFISPIAGFLTDRISRSTLLLWSELGTLLISAVVMALYLAGIFGFFTVAGCVFLMAVAGEFRYTATMALIPDITKREQLSSINGLQQAFRGIVAIAGPLLGAVGYEYFGLLPLVVVSLVSAGYASYVAYTLCSVKKEATGLQKLAAWDFIQDYAAGFKWLRGETGLKVILFHFALLCGFLALFRTLLVPHVLDVMGPGWLGAIVSAQGMGLLSAGLVIARYGKLLKPEAMLFAGCYGLGLAITFLGMLEYPAALVMMSFAVGASISLVSACNQTIWQMRTPPQMQGKIIAIRSMTLYVLSPIMIYASVPISSLFGRGMWKPIELLGPVGLHTWSGTIMMGVGLLVMVGSLMVRLICGRGCGLDQAYAEDFAK